MFLNFYHLREQPFGATPNPRYLYASAVHREALASLVYGIESNLGFAALVAEPGMGKTTLLFRILSQLRGSARTAFLFETARNSQSLLRYLLTELDVTPVDPDPVVLHEKFKEVLYEESRNGRRVVVIIDEAQNLDAKVLETVRLLSDFETPEAKLLHIILAGQPRLAEQLSCPELSQLLQRIPIVSSLRPLEFGEVTQYIDHRLHVAGYIGPRLFTNPALDAIAGLSGGVPRKINHLCFNALSLGCALAIRQIDRSLIDEVSADLDLRLLLRNVRSRHSVPVRNDVSVPEGTPKTALTGSTEIAQVPEVKVAQSPILDNAHAAAESSNGGATRKDGHCQPRTGSSPAVDDNLSRLTAQEWEEAVREARAYIQGFLTRNKPITTTARGFL